MGDTSVNFEVHNEGYGYDNGAYAGGYRAPGGGNPSPYGGAPSPASHHSPAPPSSSSSPPLSSPSAAAAGAPHGAYAPQNQFGNVPFNPNILGNIDPNLATQIGSHAFQAGQNYFNSNIKGYINVPVLKYYFDVSNSYVANKIRLVLFPFRSKVWEREVDRSGVPGASQYMTARYDLNAPDLYIPTMAFITFILLLGIEAGQRKSFNPELLGMTASTGLGMTLFELLFIKIGCYFLQISAETSLLDLISYTGYKYIGMILSLAVRMTLGGAAYVTVFAYTSIALILFFVRTLRPSLGSGGSPSGVGNPQAPHKRRRNYFLFLIAFLQVAVAWFMI